MVFLLVVQPFAIAAGHVSELSELSPYKGASNHAHHPMKAAVEYRPQTRTDSKSHQSIQDGTHDAHNHEMTASLPDSSHCGDDNNCSSGDCCHLATSSTPTRLPNLKYLFTYIELLVSDGIILPVLGQPPTRNAV